MDVDQHLAQGAQLLQGDRLAVDIRLGFSIAADNAAQQTFTGRFILLQVVFLEPFIGHTDLAGIKTGADVGALRALAYPLTIGSVTQSLPQCFEHNGFARAGFAGDNRHTRFQVQVQMIDQGEVLNAEMSEHGRLGTKEISGYLYSIRLASTRGEIKPRPKLWTLP